MQDQRLPDSALRSNAFEIFTALDAYDLASVQLVATWLDMEAYADFSRQVDAIRAHGVAIPALTVLALQLVIAHSELVSTLWQNSSVGVPASRLQEVQERHSKAISALRSAAARVLRSD